MDELIKRPNLEGFEILRNAKSSILVLVQSCESVKIKE